MRWAAFKHNVPVFFPSDKGTALWFETLAGAGPNHVSQFFRFQEMSTSHHQGYQHFPPPLRSKIKTTHISRQKPHP